MSQFSYTDSEGKTFSAKDTAANRAEVQNQGYTISDGIVKTIAEAAQGIGETMHEHPITNYNPILQIPQYGLKGIGALGGAKTNAEINAEGLTYEDSEGKLFTAKDTVANRALIAEQGYKLHDLTTEGARGAASAYAEQGFNQTLFGIPHMTDTPAEQARHDALAANNPLGNVAGGAAGLAVGMATPVLNMSGAASLAERGLSKVGIEGASFAGKLAQEAAKGAVYSTPHALAEATLKDNPTQAAEEILFGIGIGSLFGIGSQAVSKVFTGAAGLADKAIPKLQETATSHLLDMSGLTTAQRMKLGDTDKIVQTLIDGGVYKGSKKEIAQNIKDLVSDNGPKIGEVMQTLDKGLKYTIEHKSHSVNDVIGASESLDKLATENPISIKGDASINPDEMFSSTSGTDRAIGIEGSKGSSKASRRAMVESGLTEAADTNPILEQHRFSKPETQGAATNLNNDVFNFERGIKSEAAPFNMQTHIGLNPDAGLSTAGEAAENMFNVTSGKTYVGVNGFDYRKLAADIEKLNHHMVGDLRSAERSIVTDSANHILEVGNKYANKEGSLSFERANELKSYLQKEAKYRMDTSSNVNNVRKEIAAMSRQELEKAADRVASASGDMKIIEEWTKYKDLFAAGKTLEKAADKTLNAATPNSSFLPEINLFKVGPGKVAGALIGTAVFGHAGGAIGGFAGGRVDKLLNAYLKENLGTRMSVWLKKRAEEGNPALASYLALDAKARVAAKLGEIPEQIKRMAIQKIVKAEDHESPIKQILGPEANGLSKDQQFNKLSSAIAGMQSNPAAKQAHLDELTGPLKDLHPSVGDAMMQQALKQSDYIYSILPKNPSGPKPFTSNTTWKPSKAEQEEFETHLRIARNPFILLDKLKDGTITPKQVATASVMNPQILALIREQISVMAYTGNVDLSYKQKLNASILMGTNMHSALDNMQALQSVYSSGAEATPPAGKKPNLKADKMAAGKQTMAQRLMGK